MMKYLIGLLCLFSVAQAQFAPTSAKTKFVNGIGIGSKDTSQFTAADSIALTIARDSVMYYRYRGFWRPIATGGNLSAYKLISDTLFSNGYTTRARLKQGLDSLAATKGTVNSVGLTMPVAFNVANSPITSSGTIAVTAAGNATQYIRGDGALATLPTSGSGGGASVSYYLNGSVNQGTIGGVTYYEMNKTPIIGAGTDFSINANGYIASFLTDANDPALLKIPAGNWNFETFFSASSGGGSPTFYIELYKYNGTTFTLIASNSATPKLISDGTNIEAYFSTLAVPETVLTLTDRLAVRIYVSHSGRTITLHTENGHLCQVITTFTTGLTALNGLTEQVQYFATGTSGTDFNISSVSATHTFNLPTASATNRGALSSANWTTFNNKIGAGDTAAMLLPYLRKTDTASMLAPYYRTATATAALATKLNISDTAAMLANRLKISDTATMLLPFVQYSDTANIVSGYVRNNRFTDSLTNVQSRIQTKQNILTLTTTGTSGAATLVGATLNIPNYAPDLSGYVPTSRTITINGTSQDLSANRTFNVGTVTSVTASAPLASSGGTTPNITITQASGSTNGFLSSTDWTTFNNKQNALTNPVTGTGTTNYLPKFTGSTTVGNSQVFDNGTNVGIGTATPSGKLTINSTGDNNIRLENGSELAIVRVLTSGALDIWSHGDNANEIQFRQGTGSGSVKMMLDASGNLGLGVTPSAWGTANNVKALQIPSGSLWNFLTGYLHLGQNYYFDGSNRIYVNTAAATEYQQSLGAHQWFTAPSGTAGNAISFTQAMTLDASGRLGIGTPTPTTRLTVQGGYANFTDGTVNIYAGSDGSGGLFGTITNHYQRFVTNDTERMRIFSDGNVGIATFGTNAGYKLDVNGTGRFTSLVTISSDSGGSALRLIGRAAADASAIRFFANNNSTQNARIESNSSEFEINSISSLPMVFKTADTTRLTIASTGNIGIGTPSPQSQLHIYNSGGTATLRLQGTRTSDGSVGVLNFSNITDITGGYIIGSIGVDRSGFDNGGAMIFSTATAASTPTERMRITSGGNLLIGTTTDNGARLQVSGGGTFSGSVTANNFIANGSTSTAANITSLDYFSGKSRLIGFGPNTSTAGSIVLAVSNSNASIFTEALTIASTGAATFSSTLGINGVADNVKGGTYTPTGSNGGNVGSITMREHSYIRVGNIVTVSGVAEFTPTAASSLCTLEITLPFASTFTTSFQANGAASNSVSNTLGYVQSGTNKAQIIFISDTGPTAIAARYTFQYQIL